MGPFVERLAQPVYLNRIERIIKGSALANFSSTVQISACVPGARIIFRSSPFRNPSIALRGPQDTRAIIALVGNRARDLRRASGKKVLACDRKITCFVHIVLEFRATK